MFVRQEIEIDASNIRSDRSQDISRIVITDNKGRKAIAFLTVQMVSGRPRFKVIAKKNLRKESHAQATSDWMDKVVVNGTLTIPTGE